MFAPWIYYFSFYWSCLSKLSLGKYELFGHTDVTTAYDFPYNLETLYITWQSWSVFRNVRFFPFLMAAYGAVDTSFGCRLGKSRMTYVREQSAQYPAAQSDLITGLRTIHVVDSIISTQTGFFIGRACRPKGLLMQAPRDGCECAATLADFLICESV
jgi:hypothetical protein